MVYDELSESVDLDRFDPFSDEVQQCPFEHYAAMRAERPVMRVAGEVIGRPGEDVYCVSRYDDVAGVLLDWRTFSSRFGTPGQKPPPHMRDELREIASHGWRGVSTMLTEDPPSHTRYRRLVAKAFTVSRIDSLAPDIRAICEELVDGWGMRTRVDLATEFGVPIPVRSIARVLDVTDDRQGDFKYWADQAIASIGRTMSDDDWVKSQHAMVEFQQYFAEELEQRRAAPRDDFLTDLVNARLAPEDDVEGEPLSIAEMLSILQQIEVAGSETTSSLIAEAIKLLCERPDGWDQIRDDPGLIPAVVEEALRLSSPTQGLFRITTCDTEVGGVAIPKGATIWVIFGSANRDVDTFDDAEEFDPTRDNARQHLALGKGTHFCIGAPLARLEARVALETLARRTSRIELAPGDTLRYAPSFILRGLEHLAVELVYQEG